MSQLLLSGGAALALCLLMVARRPHDVPRSRVIALGAVPIVGAIMLGALAVYQVAAVGALSYYFGKLAVAVTLMDLFVVAAAVALMIPAPHATPERRRSVGRSVLTGGACLLAGMAALQVFGYVGLALSPQLDMAYGIRFRTDAKAILARPAPEARRLVKAAGLARTMPVADTNYLGAVTGDPHPLLADQWMRALSSPWSYRADAERGPLLTRGSLADPADAASVARQLMRRRRDKSVIVAPYAFPQVLGKLPWDLRDRLLTW